MKCAVVICITLIAGLFAFAYLSLRSDEHAQIVNSRHELEIALKDLQETGGVHDHTTILGTNINVVSRPFLFTNVVLIDGTNYRCAVALDDIWMRRMAATTNGVFIFFGKKRSPQLISSK
jgi:hypothetical protein